LAWPITKPCLRNNIAFFDHTPARFADHELRFPKIEGQPEAVSASARISGLPKLPERCGRFRGNVQHGSFMN
jgi:hypothetical protein